MTVESERRGFPRRDIDCKQENVINGLQNTVDLLVEAMDEGKSELERCKEQINMDISTIHRDMSALRTDVANIRSDMHTLATSVGGMKDSMDKIATALTSMADLPEVWNKLNGFWSVMTWIQKNFLLLAIFFGVIGFAAWHMLKPVLN